MRKIAILLTVLFLSAPMWLAAQKKKAIESMPVAESPKDAESQLISYSVRLETSLPDSVLYKRAMHWYKTDIKSMRVQPEECIDNQLIVAKGEFDLMGPKDSKNNRVKRGRIKYTMTTEVTGNTCVTKVTRFNISGNKYVAIEQWLDTQNENYEDKFSLLFIEEQGEDIISRFKDFVNVPMK